MTVKERPMLKDGFDLTKLLKLAMQSGKSSLGLKQLQDDLRFEVGARLALYSLAHGPSPSQLLYVLPIAFYLDTSDEELIERADRFWKTALAEEGFTIIAEREVRGSFFKVIFAGTSKKGDRKGQLSRLKKKAVKFAKDFEDVAKVVVFGASMLSPAPPQPQPPPQPAAIVERAPDTNKAWPELIQKLREGAHTAEEGAGVFLAVSKLAGEKTKKRKEDEDEEGD